MRSLKKLVRRVALWLALLPFAFACVPKSGAKAPTVDALNLAASAVVVTDAACAVAIAAQPAGADMSQFVAYVAWLEGASDAIERKGDVCGRLPMLTIVAESIKCDACATATKVAERALECPQ
jgi:hypothetical protein